MFSCKKSLLLMVTMLIGISPLAAIANQIEQYDSRKAKIINIMNHEETGLLAFNKKHINCADTQNLDAELNVDEIANSFGCKTAIGRSFMTEMLKTPLSPLDKDTILAQRVQVIKALVENSALKKEIDQLLTQAWQAESAINILFSQDFIDQKCPELKHLEIIKKKEPLKAPFQESLIKDPTSRMIGSSLRFLFVLYLTKILGEYTYLAKERDDYWLGVFCTAFCGAFAIGMVALTGENCLLASEKRIKMYSLNQFIAISEAFEELCINYDINPQFTISAITDPVSVQLIKDLKHPRYANKNSRLFVVSFVHALLYKIYDYEKHLAQLLCCIAEMDVYNAIATKIIESQHKRNKKNKFCFAQFIEQEKPLIKAQSFWNVLANNAITNSITEDKNIILTGPKAGGKTTTIKALLQNIILAQTFGVATAETFEFTMLDVIHYYGPISADTSKALSFSTEIKRAQTIVQKINDLESDKKCFIALDEVFSDVVSEQNEISAYEFAKRIAEFEGVQFIYATHFNKLKEFGGEQPTCVNYKMDAPTKNARGKLVYPFTLSQDAHETNSMSQKVQLFA